MSCLLHLLVCFIFSDLITHLLICHIGIWIFIQCMLKKIGLLKRKKESKLLNWKKQTLWKASQIFWRRQQIRGNLTFKETWNFLFTKIHFNIFLATFQTTECPWDSQSLCRQISATGITNFSDKIQR